VIRVVLVDSQRLVRTGLRRVLEESPGIEVVAEADSAETAVPSVRTGAADVILLAARPPGTETAAAVHALLVQRPQTKVVVLTPPGTAPYPAALLESGAAGFVSKACSVEDFLTAIRTVYEGGRYVGDDIARQLAHSLLPGGERSPFDALSRRELEVMGMLTRGRSVRQIAAALGLSPKTVNTYRYRLYGKLGIGNDVELTRLALRYGVAEPGPD